MTIPCLPTLIVETAPNTTATVIWLHGLGADGHDFEPIVDQLGLPLDLAVRFIFPHAPEMPVSLNGGYIMPAWYDIKHTDLGFEQDAKGIEQSAQQIQMLIDEQAQQGIKPHRIILAGFSQGGAMALHIALRQSQPLAGVMALSCYIPLADSFAAERNPATIDSAVFVGHGIDDSVVDFARGKHIQQTLAALGYAVTWQSYPMEHSVCQEEIKHIGQWIKSTLA
ncbi:MAG: alpha/beta hydrolase fold domain-containing protein [Mariprofundaceae bacterium]